MSEPAILGGLEWLATIADVTDLPVQVPVGDPTGALLPTVQFRGLLLPCSLQRWLDGRHVEELSVEQARAVGELMGRWHALAEQWAATAEGAAHYDSRYLQHALDDLRVLSTTGAITHESWHMVKQATALACRLTDTIGTSADVFGVVHGDLNPDNIIVADDGTVQFIDLAQLVVAPYLWDVGRGSLSVLLPRRLGTPCPGDGVPQRSSRTDDPAPRPRGLRLRRRVVQPRIPVLHRCAANINVVPHQRPQVRDRILP